MIADSLSITVKQCKPTLVVLLYRNYITGIYEECEGPNHYKLAHMGMINSRTYSLKVRFERSYAFLTKSKRERIIKNINEVLLNKYPRELIVQSLNMAP